MYYLKFIRCTEKDYYAQIIDINQNLITFSSKKDIFINEINNLFFEIDESFKDYYRQGKYKFSFAAKEKLYYIQFKCLLTTYNRYGFNQLVYRENSMREHCIQ